jgi:hypothetical protein
MPFSLRVACATSIAVLLCAVLPARAQQTNLLQNPGFDGPTRDGFDGCANRNAGELQLPAGWTAYFKCRSDGDPLYTNHRPEFGLIDGSVFDYRVRSQRYALKYFNFYSRNESAGVYQTVRNLTPGQAYQFGLWVQIWTSNCSPNLTGDVPTSVYEPGNLEARVCIDTDGGALDYDEGTVCSNWARERVWDKYGYVYVRASAVVSEVNVALNTRAEYPVKHNDVYADDAEFIAVTDPVAPGPRRLWLPGLSNIGEAPPSGPAPRCPAPPVAPLQIASGP